MLSLDQFLSFLLAASLLTLAPGPDNLMVLSLGMAKGRRAGMAFGLGCATGCLNHTLLAAIGVSALIAASPKAFAALQIGGGIYLLWLGIMSFKSTGPASADSRASGGQPPQSLFLKGIVANAINPKVILFFLSFLPQFVIPSQGEVSRQMFWLGLVFALQGALIFGALGYFSGAVGQWLARRPGTGILLDRLAGAIFIGIGVRLLFNQ